MKIAVLTPTALGLVFGSGAGAAVLTGGILSGTPSVMFIGAVAFGLCGTVAAGLAHEEIGPAVVLPGGIFRANHATEPMTEAEREAQAENWADAETRMRQCEGSEAQS